MTDEAELKSKSSHMTMATHHASEILSQAREFAINEGIPVIPYLIALFVEYKELREQAEAQYTKEEIDELVKTFNDAYDEGKIGPKALERIMKVMSPITGYS